MRSVVALLGAGCGLVSASRASMGKNAVMQVVEELQKMQKTLEKAMTDDKAAYEKFQCWCDKTLPETTDSIELLKSEIEAAEATAKKMTTKAKKLGTEIATLTKEIDEASSELAEMETMRAKAIEEYDATFAEYVQTIAALDKAVAVLSKHNSFLQRETMEGVATMLKGQLENMSRRWAPVLRPSQFDVVKNFLQQPTTGAYASASGQIFGILQTMKEDFEKDKAQLEADEATSAAAFSKGKKQKQDLIAAKTETRTKKEALQKKCEETAAEQTALAEQKKDTADSTTKMLMEATDDCKTNVKNYELRTAGQTKELESVNKALEFLHSDKARAIFKKAFGFAQLKSESVKKSRRASALLQAAGQKHQSKKLLMLADMAAKMPKAFEKIIKAIDKFIKENEKTLEDDLMKKNTCDGSIAETKAKIDELKAAKDISEKQIDHLDKQIEKLTSDIETTSEEIASAEQDMKDATFARKEAHAVFLEETTANQGSLEILAKTLEILQEVFGQGTALAQVPADQPAKFEEYKQNAQAPGVIAMIKSIITKTKEAIADDTKEENEATAQYEQIMQTLNELITDKKKEKVSLEEEKAAAETEKGTEEGLLKATTGELESATLFLEGEEKRCDFILKNFDIRYTAINEEIAALKSAKVAFQEDAAF